ncbi:MAG: alpha/beta fold hydrolase, partial [Acidimicrobiales bacterium]
MSSITTQDGISINYARSGTGPVLILVHGITEDLHAWDEIAAILSTDYDVIQVDLRGHGDSSPGDDYAIASFAADI